MLSPLGGCFGNVTPPKGIHEFAAVVCFEADAGKGKHLSLESQQGLLEVG
jgi:hypothetical protein